MEPGKPQLRRCAIYIRKSSEEGLEQDKHFQHTRRVERRIIELSLRDRASLFDILISLKRKTIAGCKLCLFQPDQSGAPLGVESVGFNLLVTAYASLS